MKISYHKARDSKLDPFHNLDKGNIIIIMDFLLSKYGLIFTECDSIDRGGAEVNTFTFSKYQTIFTE